jgi:hypothetical protein
MPPTSENARMWTVGAPGPGSGPPSTLVPPTRLKPDASTRIPGGTVIRVPPTSDILVNVTSGAASCASLSGQPRAGTDLEQVVPKLAAVKDPGQQFLDLAGPLRAGTDLQMRLVHRSPG